MLMSFSMLTRYHIILLNLIYGAHFGNIKQEQKSKYHICLHLSHFLLKLNMLFIEFHIIHDSSDFVTISQPNYVI